jgi:uncharacterized protein (UPF0332 family)
MDQMKWCVKTQGGIELIETNGNLAEAYVKKAEEALESLALIKARDWKISTAYYAMYFSLYAVMMRIGVKCEIHKCTVAFMKKHLREYFIQDDVELLEESLKSRIEAQYYVNRGVSDETFEKMIKKAPSFLVKCKSILMKMDEKSVGMIRNDLKRTMQTK